MSVPATRWCRSPRNGRSSLRIARLLSETDSHYDPERSARLNMGGVSTQFFLLNYVVLLQIASGVILAMTNGFVVIKILEKTFLN